MHAELAALLARPIAHRGLHACGGPGPVENSIGAATAAAAAGYGIECDVQLARDGTAIVFHDEELERLTGRTGRLADLDSAALTALPLRGGPDLIPTLPAFLAAIGGRVPLVIEIKSDGTGDLRLADATLATLAGYPGAVAIESFDPEVILHLRAQNCPRPIGLVGPPEDGSAPSAAAIAASDFLSWSFAQLAWPAAHHPTLPRSTWTVRSPAQATLAAQLGAQIVFEGFLP